MLNMTRREILLAAVRGIKLSKALSVRILNTRMLDFPVLWGIRLISALVIFALFFTAILLIKTRAYPNPNRKPMFSFHKFREFMSLKNWFLAGLSVLFLTALFLSKTRGAFLGLGIGIVVSLIYFIFNLPKGRLKNTTLIALVILTIAAGTALFYNSRSGGYRILILILALKPSKRGCCFGGSH